MMLCKAHTSVSINLMGTGLRTEFKVPFLVLLLLFLFHNYSITPCRWSLLLYFFLVVFLHLQVNSYLTLPLVSGKVASCVTFAQSSAVNRWALDKHQKTSDAVAFLLVKWSTLAFYFLLDPIAKGLNRFYLPIELKAMMDSFCQFNSMEASWSFGHKRLPCSRRIKPLKEELLTLMLTNTWQVWTLFEAQIKERMC